MAESFSLLAAIAFVSFLLLFVDNGRIYLLVLASLAGIISVAFRISFLPAVLALSVAAPVIRFLCVSRDQEQKLKNRLKPFLISLSVVAASYLTFHGGYKLLTGRLAGAPSAYQYADGFSLLSSWCPVMTTDDLMAAGLSVHLFDGTLPMTLETRRAHRWMAGGLFSTLTRSYSKPIEANAAAKTVALHILRRDPVGVAFLALRTYVRGWRASVIRTCINEDTGDRVIPDALIAEVRKHFHLAIADMPVQKTLTKLYFRHATEWYRVLLITPFLLLATAFLSQPRSRPTLFCIALFAVVTILTAVGLSVDNSIRYLHPLGWTFFVFAAYWIDLLWRRIGSSHGTPLRPATSALVALSLLAASVPASAAADPFPMGLYVKNGVLMRKGTPYHGIGANYTTLFGQLLQNKHDTSVATKSRPPWPGGHSLRAVSREWILARESAVVSAGSAGVLSANGSRGPLCGEE